MTFCTIITLSKLSFLDNILLTCDLFREGGPWDSLFPAICNNIQYPVINKYTTKLLCDLRSKLVRPPGIGILMLLYILLVPRKMCVKPSIQKTTIGMGLSAYFEISAYIPVLYMEISASCLIV